MNPGDSRTSTVSFPIRRATSSIASSAAGALSSARTISISFILWTGLKKCMPATREGSFRDPASSVILSADVLDAMIARAGACSSICAKSASLRSIRSGAASMTRSASCSASARLVVADSRASMASPSAVVSFPSSTPFLTICSTAPCPFRTASSDTSYIHVA